MNNETTPAALPVEAPAPSDEQIEALIESSDGAWHEDVFHIGGPELMSLLRKAISGDRLAPVAADLTHEWRYNGAHGMGQWHPCTLAQAYEHELGGDADTRPLQGAPAAAFDAPAADSMDPDWPKFKAVAKAREWSVPEAAKAWAGWKECRAALAAPPAVLVEPAGWKLVPIKATEAIFKAAQDTPGIKRVDGILALQQARGYPLNGWGEDGTPLEQAWAAMLAAAPSGVTKQPAPDLNTSDGEGNAND